MGDQTSMDAYNYRFDKVTEKVENLKRCKDSGGVLFLSEQQNTLHSWDRMAFLKTRTNFSLDQRQLSGLVS